jgi:hypothetical protein
MMTQMMIFNTKMINYERNTITNPKNSTFYRKNEREDLYRKWVVTDSAVLLRKGRERDKSITENKHRKTYSDRN